LPSAAASYSNVPALSSKVSGIAFTAKSIFRAPSPPGFLSSDEAPGNTTTARAELRLRVETEACDEKRFVPRFARSELLKRRRRYILSLASTVGLQARPATAARGSRSTLASGSSARRRCPPRSA
jgi:hypothetical protein